jgi:hypothetical protein
MFLVIGIPYSWGVISIYVRQYFNEVENLNMTQSEVNIIFPITFGTFFLGINVGPIVKNKIGSRKNLFLSSISIFISLLLAGFTKNIFIFTIFYGVFLGFFCGMAYIPCLYICISYFP